ncbi:MAG TPA: cupredoxin domain-containing protein [Anaeromyxobacter sp.]|nr:cupredoxin domain-containing protein [Anaeromyxobacter sp.]
MSTSMRTAVLAALALAAVAPAVRADEPKVIEIEAKRFQFTPSELTLAKDQPVILRLHSQDVVHGFYQKELGIDASIEPGRTTDVQLTPHQAGKFVTICDHFCGAGHGNMKMTITVQ